MRATDIYGRENEDGTVDLRFTTDTELVEVGLSREGAVHLMAVALQVVPTGAFESEGLRVGRFPDGSPILSFRLGPDRWLSIRLGPLDLEVLRSELLGR